MPKVIFRTNIDAYKMMNGRVVFPDHRPMVGDTIPQPFGDNRLPNLAITSIEVHHDFETRRQQEEYVCTLYFSRNTSEELCKRILNHEFGG